jgi:hypothetical protein
MTSLVVGRLCECLLFAVIYQTFAISLFCCFLLCSHSHLFELKLHFILYSFVATISFPYHDDINHANPNVCWADREQIMAFRERSLLISAALGRVDSDRWVSRTVFSIICFHVQQHPHAVP